MQLDRYVVDKEIRRRENEKRNWKAKTPTRRIETQNGNNESEDGGRRKEKERECVPNGELV